jgi:nicotinamidase-related amidase
MTSLPAIPANPHPWPFDGRWSPADTALVVIDMQTDFLKPGGYCDQMGLDVGLTSAAIEPTRRVLERMRELGFTIVHTREGHRRDLSDLNDNKRWRSARIGSEIGSAGPCGLVLTRGEPGWDIVSELYPLAGEAIIDKPGKGGFHATNLEMILAVRGIRNLVFTGVTSDCCVHTTMTNANDKGFECLVLDDCSAALDQRNHAMIMAITAKRAGQFGAVTSAATLLSALG